MVMWTFPLTCPSSPLQAFVIVGVGNGITVLVVAASASGETISVATVKHAKNEPRRFIAASYGSCSVTHQLQRANVRADSASGTDRDSQREPPREVVGSPDDAEVIRLGHRHGRESDGHDLAGVRRDLVRGAGHETGSRDPLEIAVQRELELPGPIDELADENVHVPGERDRLPSAGIGEHTDERERGMEDQRGGRWGAHHRNEGRQDYECRHGSHRVPSSRGTGRDPMSENLKSELGKSPYQ